MNAKLTPALTAALAVVALLAAPLAAQSGKACCAAGVGCGAACKANAKPSAKTPAPGPAHAATAANLAQALKAIEHAHKAIEAGETKTALAHLARARGLVRAEHKVALWRAKPRPAGETYANVTCPVMGSPIDPKKVTPALVRAHRGEKVAFCCGGCPAAWDRLTDKQKDAKLAAARPRKKAAAASPAPGVYANVTCPVMGSPINPRKVTPDLVRTHRGRQVAFCCAGCPAAWDRLSDSQKDAKLARTGTK
jgi:hypothetical protein